MHRLAETALTTRIREGWTVVALFLILVVGIIDYLTGPEITFAVFYLIPVAFAAWISGTKGAVGASALAALAWLLAEIGSSRIGNAAFVYAWNFCVRLLFLLMVALLLARLHEMLRRERTLSRSDALTGLLNARAFRQIAESEIARAHRYGQALSLAFIDIDDFKRVNDRAGHAAGDQLIQQIADTLRSELRASDIVARYGGDEFVVLLPVTDEASARTVIDKLLKSMRRVSQQSEWQVTLSAGVVTCRGARPSVDALLEQADRLMYEVKSSGKNGARFGVCAA